MRIMCHVTRAICIYPNQVLAAVCREVGFCKPVYSSISQERSMFQFIVKFTRYGGSNGEELSEIEGTGFSFRDKDDAVESAALSALEILLYYHGISSGQYNDIVFCELCPAFTHLSDNVKGTKASVMRLLDEIKSLCKFVDEARLLFRNRKSEFDSGSDNSADIAMLDECESKLHGLHDTLLADTQQYRNSFHMQFRPNRTDNHSYYEGLYSVKKEMDLKVKCNSALRLTLDKLCDATCYAAGPISSTCISKDSYVAELSVINPSHTDNHNNLLISSGKCTTVKEAQHTVTYRAIRHVCQRERNWIIDPGYNDVGDMKRDIHSFRYEVPGLCEMLAKLKNIVHRGLCIVETLGHRYYRELRRHSLLSELRVSLGDSISELGYICKCVDMEIGKAETYSCNLPLSCSLQHGSRLVICLFNLYCKLTLMAVKPARYFGQSRCRDYELFRGVE